jgi:hypothetical protein
LDNKPDLYLLIGLVLPLVLELLPEPVVDALLPVPRYANCGALLS